MSAFTLFAGPVAQFAIGLVIVSLIGAHFVTLGRVHERLFRRAFRDDVREADVEPSTLTLQLKSDAHGGTGDPDAQRVRRVRATRLPLPRRVLELPESEELALYAVNRFMDQLAELSIDAWLNVGREIMNGRPGMADRSAAWSVLTSTISRHDLGIAAWYVRDAVDTSALFAREPGSDPSPGTVRLFSAAKNAAEEAALALLAKRHLPPHEFGILVEPFRDIVTPRPDAPHGAARRSG